MDSPSRQCLGDCALGSHLILVQQPCGIWLARQDKSRFSLDTNIFPIHCWSKLRSRSTILAKCIPVYEWSSRTAIAKFVLRAKPFCKFTESVSDILYCEQPCFFHLLFALAVANPPKKTIVSKVFPSSHSIFGTTSRFNIGLEPA